MKKKAPMVKKTTVDIRYSQEKGWEVDIIKTIPMTLPLKDYLALEQFTDTGYKL